MDEKRQDKPAMRWSRGLFRLSIGSIWTVVAVALIALAAVSLSRLQPVKDRWLRLDR